VVGRRKEHEPVGWASALGEARHGHPEEDTSKGVADGQGAALGGNGGEAVGEAFDHVLDGLESGCVAEVVHAGALEARGAGEGPQG
jgi:hypothetical protein